MGNNIPPALLNRFSVLLKRNRLAHAYLLVGPAHAGKGETALALAKLINCEAIEQRDSFCNECLNCRKVDLNAHPDIHFLKGNLEESIKIEDVRELLSQIVFKPFMARKKVFIVENVENLTPEAGNAFLKTLEEPTANSLIFLTTANPSNVLDTIKSRCHLICFYPASRQRLGVQLEKSHALNNLKAQCLAYLAEGYEGRAKRLLEEKIFDKRNEIFDRFIFSPDETFLKKITSDKQAAKEFLEILLSVVRDSLFIQRGVEQRYLYHADRFVDLNRFQSKFSFEELNELSAQIIETSRLLIDNFNIKIPLFLIKEFLWVKQ